MTKQHILFSAALLTGLSFGLPAQAEPPPWVPAYGQRAKQAQSYRYVYYPQRQVYYAPQTRSWFWLSGGNWQIGATLPYQYQAYVTSGGVSISLNASRPYVQHVYVEEHYGRPWRSKHKYDKRRYEEWRHNDERGFDGDYGRKPDKHGKKNKHDDKRDRGHGRQD